MKGIWAQIYVIYRDVCVICKPVSHEEAGLRSLPSTRRRVLSEFLQYLKSLCVRRSHVIQESGKFVRSVLPPHLPTEVVQVRLQEIKRYSFHLLHYLHFRVEPGPLNSLCVGSGNWVDVIFLMINSRHVTLRGSLEMRNSAFG